MLDTQKMEARRKSLRLSQEEAAARAGLAGRQAWNNIASGRKSNVTLDTLNKIAGALDCDPRDLIKTNPVAREAVL
ncbi:MAG TPA: helix-turn-helix transcriptional regulator [Tepidisphaeraceae bacterium]|nr:helix-turn-helix transcriptional regulator [Tepidisphaeraceae bacterium]